MSLINKMLLDLDARADQARRAGAQTKSITSGLRPANDPSASTGLRTGMLMGALLTIVIGLIFAWLRGDDTEVTAPAVEVHMTSPAAGLPPDAHANAEPAPAPTPVRATSIEQPLAPEPQATPRHDIHPVPTAVSAQAKTVDEHREGARPNAGVPTPPHRVATKPLPAPPPPASSAAAPTSTTAVPPQGELTHTIRIPDQQELANRSYHQGLRYQGLARISEAESLYREALRYDPLHPEAREALAALLVQQGHWADARQILYEGLTLLPDDYRFPLALARIHVEQGNESRAIALLEGSLEQGRRDADYLGLIAVLYQRAGRHEQAYQRFSEALALRPFAAKWWLGLGISAEAIQDLRAAQNAYLKVQNSVQVDPTLIDFASERLELVGKRLAEMPER